MPFMPDNNLNETYRGWIINVRMNSLTDFSWSVRSEDGFVTGSMVLDRKPHTTSNSAMQAAHKFVDEWYSRNPSWVK